MARDLRQARKEQCHLSGDSFPEDRPRGLWKECAPGSRVLSVYLEAPLRGCRLKFNVITVLTMNRSLGLKQLYQREQAFLRPRSLNRIIVVASPRYDPGYSVLATEGRRSRRCCAVIQRHPEATRMREAGVRVPVWR